MHEREDKLRQEILNDARRKAERTVERAKRDADKALGAARKRQEAMREARIRKAERIAADKCRALHASIGQELQKEWLQRREKVLDDLFDEILAGLEAGAGVDQEESLAELVEEATAAVGPGELVVHIRPADKAKLTEERLAEIAERALPDSAGSVTFTIVESAEADAGVIVTTTDNRRHFDNTYATRLQYLRPELRVMICARVGTYALEPTSQQREESRHD